MWQKDLNSGLWEVWQAKDLALVVRTIWEATTEVCVTDSGALMPVRRRIQMKYQP
jgi:hypothetical protein